MTTERGYPVSRENGSDVRGALSETAILRPPTMADIDWFAESAAGLTGIVLTRLTGTPRRTPTGPDA